MAVSGTETTRIGGYLHGVGRRLTITAKAASEGTTASRNSIAPVRKQRTLFKRLKKRI